MKLKINGKIYEPDIKTDEDKISIEIDGKQKTYDILDTGGLILKQESRVVKSDYFIDKEALIWIDDEIYSISEIKKIRGAGKSANSEKKSSIDSPLPGVITKIYVKAGSKLKKGDLVLIIESMKMANEIKAEFEGTVKSVLVKEGEQVSMSDKLVLLE